MLKKTITYVDYDGAQRTEDFYFNLNKAETFGYMNSEVGGIDAFIDKVVRAKDNVTLWNIWSDFIKLCYGEKSDDGRRFIKSEELSEAFAQTEAYSQLMMELLSDGGDKAAEFVNGVVSTVKMDPEKTKILNSFKVVS